MFEKPLEQKNNFELADSILNLSKRMSVLVDKLVRDAKVLKMVTENEEPVSIRDSALQDVYSLADDLKRSGNELIDSVNKLEVLNHPENDSVDNSGTGSETQE